MAAGGAASVARAFRAASLFAALRGCGGRLWPPRRDNLKLLLGIFAGSVAALCWAIKPRWGADAVAMDVVDSFEHRALYISFQ